LLTGREAQSSDNRRRMGAWQVDRVFKRDTFGRIERLTGEDGVRLTRRVASGGALPLSGVVARFLAKREQRALQRLEGLACVPSAVEDEGARAAPCDGIVPRGGDVFLREWIDGSALPLAETLPENFFDLLDELVGSLHARGVCHNDLHKEPNIIVGLDGRPALVDFQLASVHEGDSRSFRARCAEDDRHVHKHRVRYTREGRGPAAAAERGRGRGKRRRPLAFVWRRLGKPVYLLITRGLLRTRDGAEDFRPSTGPWPQWTAPIGREVMK